MKILGIDHGTNYAGAAVYDSEVDKFAEIGLFDLTALKGDDAFLFLHNAAVKKIREHQVEMLALEKPMDMTNARTSRVLIQAYMAVKMAGLLAGIPIVEVAPTQAKLAAAGHGQAQKGDVARMLSLQYKIAYDTLAVPVLYKDKKRRGQIKDRLFDPSDAAALCIGAVMLQKRGATA